MSELVIPIFFQNDIQTFFSNQHTPASQATQGQGQKARPFNF
jgi:hypothetical protein